MSKFRTRLITTSAASMLVIGVMSGTAQGRGLEIERICAKLTVQQCNQYKEDLSSYTTAFANWKSALQSIDNAQKLALSQAQSDKLTSFKQADALAPRARATLRLTAIRQYVIAVRAANTTHSSAIVALGPAPKRPVRPAPASSRS